MKRARFKYGLWLCFWLMLALPTMQGNWSPFELKSLHGSFKKIKEKSLSLEGWFDGSYQKNKEQYSKDNIGFRPFFIRLKNQIEFSIFDKINANGVVIGKDDYLFIDGYINTHLGLDFLGEEYIQNKVDKLKKIADTLKTKNIDLIVIFPPGKGSFYPEFIPEKYNQSKKTISNYDYYSEALKKDRLNYIDFNQWFRLMKDSSNYLLYPKNGIHWSNYGAFLAADSIIHFIEKLRNIELPELVLNDIEITNKPRNSDRDIEDALNLFIDLPKVTMAYPIFDIALDTSMQKTKVLTIADSFYWILYNWKISEKVFDEGEFWYYNKKIYGSNYKGDGSLEQINYISEIEKNKVILLICTDRNLNKFAFGFIDRLYIDYFGESKEVISLKEVQVRKYIKNIKNSPNWLAKITEKAKKDGVPVEEAIRKNAEYVYLMKNQ